MSNEMVPHNPHYLALQAATRIKDPTGGALLPRSNADSAVSDTHFIIHRDGVGASTLALFLEPCFAVEPLILEVGTNISRALQSLPKERHFHTQDGDEAAIIGAIDWRLATPERPAIIECGRTAYKQGIIGAHRLSNPPFNAPVHIIFLASEHDRDLSVVKMANQSGLTDVLVCGDYLSDWRERPSVIKVPTLGRDLATNIYQSKLSLRDALEAVRGPMARWTFANEYQTFLNAVCGGSTK